MDLQDIIAGAESAVAVKSVYGEIYEKNGLSVLPAAKVMGGAGGGEGEDESKHAEGKGTGFGIRAKPTGVFVITKDDVRWKPALDWNRIILVGQIVAIVGLLVGRSIAKTHTKRAKLATHADAE